MLFRFFLQEISFNSFLQIVFKLSVAQHSEQRLQETGKLGFMVSSRCCEVATVSPTSLSLVKPNSQTWNISALSVSREEKKRKPRRVLESIHWTHPIMTPVFLNSLLKGKAAKETIQFHFSWNWAKKIFKNLRKRKGRGECGASQTALIENHQKKVFVHLDVKLHVGGRSLTPILSQKTTENSEKN